MPQINTGLLQPGPGQGGQHQPDDLYIAGDARMAVKLGPGLHGRAGVARLAGPGMQDGAQITKAHGNIALQAVGVNTRDLGRDVSPDPHQAAA